MDLGNQVEAASKAAAREVMREFCLANSTKTLEEIASELDSNLVDVMMSLTPADLQGAAARTSGKKKKTKTTTTKAAATGSKRPKPLPATERATVSQLTVTTELMRFRNRQDIGESFPMAKLKEVTGGTTAQVRTAMQRIGGLDGTGKGRATTYTVTDNAGNAGEEEAAE